MPTPLYVEEATQHDGQPRHLYKFTLTGGDTAIHAYTDHHTDLTVSGQLYTSVEAISHTSLSLMPLGRFSSFDVRFPLTLSIAGELIKKAAPRRVELELRRYHVNTTNVSMIAKGIVSHPGARGVHEGYVRVESRFASSLETMISSVVMTSTCNRMLGDTLCTVDLEALKVTTTIASIDADPHKVTVTSMGGNPSQWAQGGELIRISDGERSTILDQTGAVLILLTPFRNLAGGNSVKVYPGCARTPNACTDKFSNFVNFGGFPGVNPLELFRYGVRGAGG